MTDSRNGYEQVRSGLLAFQRKEVTLDQLLQAMDVWSFGAGSVLAVVMDGLGDGTTTMPYVTESHDGDSGSIGSLRSDLSKIGDTQAERAVHNVVPIDQTQGGDPEATGAERPRSGSMSNKRFEIKTRLASGGLGDVFLAEDKEVRREIALKCIRENYADDDHFRAKFKQETEITGRLEHPHIIPIYGAGESIEGRPFYAMRFIEGENLRVATKEFHESGRRTDRKTPEFRRLLMHFVDVCNAIDYAHSRNVIHRDIKPNNIMLGKFGETYVVDWGLAKSLGESEATGEASPPVVRPSVDTEETRRGSEIGTRGYMAPEQAQGNVDAVGISSDIYGLGATLYSLVTNQSPIDSRSNTEDFLDRVRRGEFANPSDVNPQTPKPLEAICMRALAIDPADRHASAGELGREVESWLGDEDVPSYQEGPIEGLARWGRGHVPLILSGIAALAVCAAVMALLAFMSQRSRRRDQIAMNHLERGVYQCQAGLLDRGLLDLSQAITKGRSNQTIVTRANQQFAAWSHELEFRMPHLGSVLALGVKSSESNDSSAGNAHQTVTLADDGIVSIWDTEDQSLLRQLSLAIPAGGEIVDGAFSPDNSSLAYVLSVDGNLEARIWDLDIDARLGDVFSLKSGESQALVDVAWVSSDNVAFFLAKDELLIHNSKDQTTREFKLGHRSGIGSVALSENRQFVLTCGNFDGWKVWKVADLIGADSKQPDEVAKGKLRGLRFATAAFVSESPRSVWIASKSPPTSRDRDCRVTVWDFETEWERPTIMDVESISHSSSIKVLLARPNGSGTSLLTGASDQSLRWWSVSSHRKATLVGQRKHDAAITCGVLASDGYVTGAMDGTARYFADVWQATPLRAFPTMVSAASNSDLVLVGFEDGNVDVFSTNANVPEHLKSIPHDPERSRITSVCLNPSGDLAIVASQCYSEVVRPDECPSIVQVWSLASDPPKQVGVNLMFDAIVFGLAFHPNEPSFATVGANKSIQIWSTKTTEELNSFSTDDWITSVDFSSNGDAICVGLGNGMAQVINLDNGNTTELPHRKLVDSVGFGSSKGKEIVATGSFDNTVELWSGDANRLVTPLIHERELLRIRFDPSDRTLLHTLTQGGVVRRWDTETGTLVGTPSRLVERGKDLGVGKYCVAVIGEAEKTLYTRSRHEYLDSGHGIEKRTGWKFTSHGHRPLAHTEWIQEFASGTADR